jgi:hypothetical protein
MGVELTTTPQNSFQIYDDLACVETRMVCGQGGAAGFRELRWTTAKVSSDPRSGPGFYGS